MLEIKFDIFETDIENLTGFELGDIYISDGRKVCTSKGESSKQSMMIYLFVTDFLRCLMDFSVNKRNVIEVNGIDSSYCIIIKRKKEKCTIEDNKTIIYDVGEKELVDALYHSACSFYNQYVQGMDISNAVKKDYIEVLQKFKNSLN